MDGCAWVGKQTSRDLEKMLLITQWILFVTLGSAKVNWKNKLSHGL